MSAYKAFHSACDDWLNALAAHKHYFATRDPNAPIGEHLARTNELNTAISTTRNRLYELAMVAAAEDRPHA